MRLDDLVDHIPSDAALSVARILATAIAVAALLVAGLGLMGG